MGSKKTLVIRNGTLIDGSGRPPVRNDTIVIAGNRIRSIGASPPDMSLEDPRSVEVIDATGQWIMPGLGKHGVISSKWPTAARANRRWLTSRCCRAESICPGSLRMARSSTSIHTMRCSRLRRLQSRSAAEAARMSEAISGSDFSRMSPVSAKASTG
jgi:hypothetical protein